MLSRLCIGRRACPHCVSIAKLVFEQESGLCNLDVDPDDVVPRNCLQLRH
jgi:hypothetical protein